MILANEAVAGLLASRRRDALYRVHERPDPQAIELLLAKLAGARDADAARARASDAPMRRRVSPRRISARVGEYVRELRSRAGGVPGARPARTQAGPLRPAKPRPLGTLEPRLLPLHLADPPVPGRRLPPCAARASSVPRDDPLPGTCPSSPSGRRCASGRPSQVEYAADAICLAWLLDRRLFELRLGHVPRRGGDGRDRLGDLRAVRRCLRGLPACAALAGRLLRARSARHRPRRTAQRPPLSARRSDRGQGRRHRSYERQDKPRSLRENVSAGDLHSHQGS